MRTILNIERVVSALRRFTAVEDLPASRGCMLQCPTPLQHKAPCTAWIQCCDRAGNPVTVDPEFCFEGQLLNAEGLKVGWIMIRAEFNCSKGYECTLICEELGPVMIHITCGGSYIQDGPIPANVIAGIDAAGINKKRKRDAP